MEWPISRMLTPPNTGKAVEPRELSVTFGGDAKGCSHFGYSLAVSYKLNTHSTYDSAITLVAVYPTELKTYVHMKT